MVLGIDPTVDFAFKLVFGSPDHPQVTIRFLNSVLNFRQPVTEVEFLNPIQGREHLEGKLSVLDVLASDSDGRQYNIEMQTTLPMADLLPDDWLIVHPEHRWEIDDIRKVERTRSRQQKINKRRNHSNNTCGSPCAYAEEQCSSSQSLETVPWIGYFLIPSEGHARLHNPSVPLTRLPFRRPKWRPTPLP